MELMSQCQPQTACEYFIVEKVKPNQLQQLNCWRSLDNIQMETCSLMNADSLNVVHVVVVFKKNGEKKSISVSLKREKKLFCGKTLVSCNTCSIDL